LLFHIVQLLTWMIQDSGVRGIVNLNRNLATSLVTSTTYLRFYFTDA
jgi:hypothetical protein